MKKRILAFMLVLVMLLSTLISCKKDSEEENTPNSSDAQTEEISTIDEDEEDIPEIPEITIGRTITVYKRDGATLEEWDHEHNPNSILIMNDALFERNVTLQDKYDITFDFISTKREVAVADFATIHESGEDTVDFIDFDSGTLNKMARVGYLRNINDLEYCDYDKDYWYGDCIDDLSDKSGRSYIAFGYSNVAFQWCSYSVYYNKTLFTDLYKDEDIYQTVFDKKWTLELMYEYAKGVAAEGGNDADVTDDTYGIIMPGGGWYSTFFGSGLQAVSKNDNGDFVSNLQDETLLGHLQKVLETVANNKVTLEASRYADVNVLYAQGKGLFYTESFTMARYFQEHMDDYGILPAPLMNEGDDYYTHTHFLQSSAIGVPALLGEDKLDEVSILLEDANYYSKKIQTPVMLETVLKGRMAQDPESVQTIEIIISNIHIDPSLVHIPENVDSFDVTFRSLVKRASTNGTVSGITLASDLYTCHNLLQEHLNKNFNG